MTDPGDATTVGAIVAYLRMNREEWNRDVDAAERDARRLGSTSPDIRIRSNAAEATAGLAAVAAAERSVGDEANKSKPFVVNLWGALAAVAPAALPIAAVAGGALIGLVPVLATVALGAKGIADEFKSGELQAGPYGKSIQQLDTWFGGLKKTAAAGLLDGVDRAIKSSQPLFGAITGDVRDMSTQLGNIVAGGGPALLSLLNQLNPLFLTFGNLLTRGATNLEHMTQSSDGVSHFVAYVQAELPVVVHFLGEVLTLFGHLAQAGAPFGGVLLTGLTLFVQVLNAIPIGVLQTAIPLAVSLYAAFKSYQAVTSIIAGVSGAIAKISAPLAASAAVTQAAALQTEAAVTSEAAVVAQAKAAEATAAAEAAVEIAAAAEATSSVLAAGAAASAESAIEFAAAMQIEAEAAILAAGEIGAAATTAAEEVTASGAAASAGWASMLGPLAAVAIGVGILGFALSGNDDDAREAAEAMDSYAESVKKSTDALNAANITQTQENLSQAGAYLALDRLQSKNRALSLSTEDLTKAVNGTDAQYQRVIGTLKEAGNLGGDVSAMFTDQGRAALGAIGDVSKYRKGLIDQIEQQQLLTAAQRDQQAASDGGVEAARRAAASMGVTKDAYLDAQLAAQKSIDKSREQTLQWQLENTAGKLLSQTLDALSGKNLSYAQAQNTFEQQLATGGPRGTPGTPGTPGTGNAAGVEAARNARARAIEAEAIAQTAYNKAVAAGDADKVAAAHLRLARAKDAVTNATHALTEAEKKGGGTPGTPGTAADTRLKGMSAAAVQNRSDILSLVQAAEQSATTYGDMTGSSEKARQKLIELRAQLINSRVAMGENRGEVTKYVDSILTIPKKVPPTKLDVEKAAADKKVAELQAQIKAIKQGKVPGLKVNSLDADQIILDLQNKIDRLHGKTVHLTTIVTAKTEAGNKAAQDAYLDFLLGRAGKAAGGPVVGPGAKGVDSVPHLLAPGEFVMSDKAVDRFGLPFMRALNAGQAPQLQAAAPRATAVASSAPAPAAGLNAGNIAQALHGMHLVIDAGSLGTLTGFVDSRVDGTLGRAARTSTARQSRVEAFGRT